jgi:hypothetical protein
MEKIIFNNGLELIVDKILTVFGEPEMFGILYFENYPPDTYAISSYGRVFSIQRNMELCQYYDNHGYLLVHIKTNRDGIYKNARVNRLVASVFVPKTQEDILLGRDFVNHKNLVKNYNFYKNLEWTTSKENTQHAFANNAHINPEPKMMMQLITRPTEIYDYNKNNVGIPRITDEQVHMVCHALVQGKSYGEAAIYAGLEDNSYNRNIICNIVSGKRHTNISKIYNLPRVKALNDYAQYVIPVCRLLQEKKYQIKQIIEMLNIPGDYDRVRMFISGIKNRHTYTEISKDFDF